MGACCWMREPGRKVARDRYEKMIQTATEGIWTIDGNDLIDFVNERGASILGYAPEEMLGRPFSDFLFPEDARTIEESWSSMKMEVRTYYMVRARRKDGSEVLIMTSSSPFLDSNGHYRGALAMFTDITAWKKAEKALMESEGMFKGLSEVSPAIIVVYRGHRHLYVNPAAISIYGYSKEELLSMDILALFHPDDREIMWKRMEDRLADREQPRRYELRVITKAGELKWLDTSAHKITYDGEPASIVIAMDITERKMTEEALKESETRYRSIVETAQEGVMLSDLSGRIIFANKRMTNLLGYSMEELVGKPGLELVPESVRKDIAQRINDRKQGIEENYEIMFCRKDGQVVWLLAGGSPLYDSEGRHSANLGMYSDITERKKGEQALMESERRYRSLFENLHEGVALMKYVLDEGGHVTDLLYLDVNEAVIAGIGRSREEMIGMTIRQLMGPEKSADLIMMAGQARADGGTVSFETSLPSGQAYFLNFLAPVSDEMCIISSMDITSTRRAKQRAEENRAQLRAIIENSPVAVVVADERSRIILTNKAADEIFRRPIPFMDRYESQAILRLHHPDGRPYDPRDLPLTRSALDGERSNGVGMDIVWPDGQVRHLLVNSAPIVSDRGRVTGAVGVFQDISELTQMEQQLKQRADELARSNAELQQFAYVASHDLQEPLRMVTMFLSLLKDRYRDQLDERAKMYMDYAIDGGLKAKMLIRDLLDFSRVDSPERVFEPTDMEEVLGMAMKNLLMQVEEERGTITHDPLPVIRADRKQMVQVMQNLLSNGIKFHGEMPPVVHVSCVDDDGEWRFSVKDNGIGIDPKHADKLFALFQRLQTDEMYKGTGLGLAISKKIVERHGGRIWFESEPGEGTTFYFTMPKDAGG